MTKPKVPKYPGVQESYAWVVKDDSKFYKYITNLFEPPELDAIDIRIIEMEKSLYAMIDDDSGQLSPPPDI